MKISSYIFVAIGLIYFSITNINAQDINVSSFSEQIEPMTVTMQRTDYNGNVCALLKVQIPMSDVAFEGNVIGKILHKTNEYWVYLTPGTKTIKIKVPGYYTKSIRFEDFGICRVASKKIYSLLLLANSDENSIESQFKHFYESVPQYSLMCQFGDGDDIVFYNADDWKHVKNKSNISFYGVTITNKQIPLVVKLIDEGKPYETFKWSDSFRKDDSLPISIEAEIIYLNKDSLNKNLKYFGGTGIGELSEGIWTRSCTANSNWTLLNRFGVGENCNPSNRLAKRLTSPLLPLFIQKGNYKIKNFSLKCDLGGVEYYFTKDEWERLSTGEKRKFNKHGLVIFTNKNAFILDLNDKSSNVGYPEILEGDKRLPSETEAIYIMKSINHINMALKTFGGTSLKDTFSKYWIGHDLNVNDNGLKRDVLVKFKSIYEAFVPTYGIITKSRGGNIRLVQNL